MLIDRAVLDDDDGRPVYLRIADAIIAKVHNGELKPGDEYPSETDLATSLGVAHGTVKDAYEQVRAQGYMFTQRGQRSKVRAIAPVRTLSTSRYFRDYADSTAFAEDYGIRPDQHTVTVKMADATAGDAHSRLLNIEKGTKILRRSFVDYAAGIPCQIRVSVMPLSIVRDEIRDPERQPWPGGALAELRHLGFVVVDVPERARFRPPTADEARELGISKDQKIVEITRTFIARGGRAVECSEIVMPAEGVTLEWHTRLSES